MDEIEDDIVDQALLEGLMHGRGPAQPANPSISRQDLWELRRFVRWYVTRFAEGPAPSLRHAPRGRLNIDRLRLARLNYVRALVAERLKEERRAIEIAKSEGDFGRIRAMRSAFRSWLRGVFRHVAPAIIRIRQAVERTQYALTFPVVFREWHVRHGAHPPDLGLVAATSRAGVSRMI